MLAADQPIWVSSEGPLTRLSHKYRRRISITLASFSIIILLALYNNNKSNPAPEWDWKRDGKNLHFNSDQCDQAFPGLFIEIDRAVNERRNRNITLEELNAVKPQYGYVRAMIYEQELYIITVDGTVNSRNLATLHALHRAILTSPEPLPNIEFTFMAGDKIDATTSWSFTRRAQDTKVWLMPDFGFWSWPEPKVGSYTEVQRKILALEEHSYTWENKKNKLIWRGAAMGNEVRKQLVDHTKGKEWADVKFLDWVDKEALKRDMVGMDQHCGYKFVAHTEGMSYSGRLKYLQNCRSVVVAHKLEWIQHHHPLMVSSGRNQNFVEVENDFGDLEGKMVRLLEDDGEARRIADNGVRTFRERYLTPAAETCYWRKLVKGWAEVSFEPEFYELKDGVKTWRGVPAESYFLLGKTEWEPY